MTGNRFSSPECAASCSHSQTGGSAYGQKTHDTEIQGSKAEGSQEGKSRKTQNRQSQGCKAEGEKGRSESAGQAGESTGQAGESHGKKGESTSQTGESACQEGCCQARGTKGGWQDCGDTFRLVGQGSSDFRYPVGNRFLEEGRH